MLRMLMDEAGVSHGRRQGFPYQPVQPCDSFPWPGLQLLYSNRLNNETWKPPGHFYSPLVDPLDSHVRAILDNFSSLQLTDKSGVVLDDGVVLTYLDRISSFYKDLPFPKRRTSGTRYFFENGAYEYGDAVVFFGMLRFFKPKRVIEAGSGFSSCLAMDTNDLFFKRSIYLKFIDPNPETLLDLIDGDPFYISKIVPSKLQDVPLEDFEVLEAGDILFIDSSHVAKLGSDVNDYMFRILPALQRGVVVHIHDIPYPFEYSPEWIDKQNRSWNEVYALRAFLQFNSAFRIIYFNHYVYCRYPEILAEKMPMCLRNCGASIWLEKVL